MLVARTTLRRPAGEGARARSCTAGVSCPCRGRMSTVAATSGGSVVARRCSTRRISAAPARNTNTSPGPSARAWRTASATAGSIGVVAAMGRYRVVTGWAAPGACTTVAPPSRPAVAATSRVADITTTARSGRKLPAVSSTRASPVSADRERSWNSSKITTSTPASSGSRCRRRVRIPSVTNSMRVRALVRRSSRVVSPMNPPTGSPRCPARKWAMARAATRRGSSTSTRPPTTPERAFGTRVVLPEPGAAATTTRRRAVTASPISPNTASMGSGTAASTGRSLPVPAPGWIHQRTPSCFSSSCALRKASMAAGTPQ